jgi:hypothetical protein
MTSLRDACDSRVRGGGEVERFSCRAGLGQAGEGACPHGFSARAFRYREALSFQRINNDRERLLISEEDFRYDYLYFASDLW